MDRSLPSGGWATGWKASLTARVGFWRALVEMLIAGFALACLYWAATAVLGSPWAELLNSLSLGLYGFAAWRLAPGTGGWLRRGARAFAWGLLFGLIGGTQGYLLVRLAPYAGPYLGARLSDIPAAEYILSALVGTIGPFCLTRTLLALWAAGRTRLRWRLTYAFVLVAVLTALLITPAQSLLLALLSLTAAPTATPPGVAAQQAAAAVEPLVQQSATSDQLVLVLRGLLDGGVRVPLPPGQTVVAGAPPPGFSDVRRILLLRPDGTVLAGAGDTIFPVGASLPATEAAGLAPLLARIRGGGCANGRPADGLLADSAACALLDDRGVPIAMLLVESRIDSVAQFRAAMNRILTIVLLNTSAALSSLLVALLGILLVAGGSGYYLARGLTQRLERLATITGDLTAGDLARRIDVDAADEIGRLSADFNTMAARLQEREAALTVERDRAERALQANRRLVANVSHELRTPLTTLRGYLEALEQEVAQVPAHDLAVMQGEVGRLTALIEDLFTLARAEAQQLPLTLEAVDAGAVVHELTATLAPLARRERQIELVTALPADLPRVHADRARLGQVVLNLLQNALRYTLPGGIIAVEGSAGDGVVTLAVNDTGVGIPPEELPLVFERFYRSDSSRARESGGAGLGLALVRELVTAMGGSVDVQSTPGRGSRFSIALAQMP